MGPLSPGGKPLGETPGIALNLCSLPTARCFVINPLPNFYTYSYRSRLTGKSLSWLEQNRGTNAGQCLPSFL